MRDYLWFVGGHIYAEFASSAALQLVKLVKWAFGFTAAAITGCVGMFIPEVLGLGSETISFVLSGSYEAFYLILLLFLN